MHKALSLATVGLLGCGGPGSGATTAPQPSVVVTPSAPPTASLAPPTASLAPPNPSAPAASGSPPRPAPEPLSTPSASIVLQPAPARVRSGASQTIKLVNVGSATHQFEVGDASSSCGRFRWRLTVFDARGRRLQPSWDNPIGPCGAVFIPAHMEKLPPGDIATFTIDTSQQWYLVAAPVAGLQGGGMQPPPREPLSPGDYVVEVRGGDVIARTTLTIEP